MNAIRDLISGVIEVVTGAQHPEPDWQAQAAALQAVATRLQQSPAHWQPQRQEMISQLEAALAVLRHHDPSRDIRHRLAQALQQFAAQLHHYADQPAFVPLVPELQARLKSWQILAHGGAVEEMERLEGRLRTVADALEPRVRELIQAHDARVDVRHRYEAARAAADASPQIALRLTAHELRESDSAAEGRLLRAQAAFLDVIPLAAVKDGSVVPEARQGVTPPLTSHTHTSSPPAPKAPPAPVAHPAADTKPAPAQALPPPALIPPKDDSPESLSAHVWQVLHRGHTAVAYQLVRLAEADGHPLPGTPPLALLKALALAEPLQQPTGALATEITAAFASLDPRNIAGLPTTVAATHLLTAAALLRPLLLAPHTQAPRLVSQLQLPSGCTALHTLLQGLSTGTLRSHPLGVRAWSSLREEGSWREELNRQRETIRDWRSRAPTFGFKDPAAAVIWRDWQKPDGEIDRLLAPILAGIPGGVAVRAQLHRLSADLDAWIAEADRRSDRRGDPLHGAALEQLHQRVGEATALAGGWLTLLGAQPSRDNPLTLELERVHALFARHHEAAGQELEVLSRHGDSHLATAALIASRSLKQVWALFDPQAPLPAGEPNPQHLLNRPLLELRECPLRADGSLPGPVRPVLRALAFRGEPPPLLASFEMRLSQRDLLGAAQLAEIAALEAPTDVAQMTARLELATQAYWQTQRSQLAQLGESLEAGLVYGLLTPAQRDASSARLVQMERSFGDLLQAESLEQQIEQLRGEIAAASQRRCEEILEDLRTVKDTAQPADLKVMEQVLAAGDLPLATDYLARLWEGLGLAEVAHARDPFQELHGTPLAHELETFLSSHGAALLIHQIERGSPIGALSYEEVPELHRKEAARLLECWLEIQGLQGDSRIVPLQRLLTGLGFGHVRPPQSKGQRGEVWETQFDCDPIADRSICPVPRFGSLAHGHYRLLVVSERVSPSQLLSHVGDATGQPTLVLYFGRLSVAQRRELAAQMHIRRQGFLLIDEVLLVYLTAEHGSRLPSLFACALPFTSLDPFVTTISLVPPELFFGRRRELSRILDPTGPSLVYGGRQMGKTALLRHAEHCFHAPQQQHYAAFLNLKAAGIGWETLDSTHLWRAVWRRLVEIKLLPASTPEPHPVPAVRGRVEHFLDTLESRLAAHPEMRILLLLDDADRFLEDDAWHAHRTSQQLRQLMEASDHRFKVVLAGSHSVLRAAEQTHHPLKHAVEALEVGPLTKRSEWREARQLVQGPLTAVGFRLERPAMVDRMLAQTGFHPSLVQIYGSKLLARMTEEARFQDGPRYLIPESRLEEVFQSTALRNELRQKLRLTLEMDPRYAVIAYAMAHRSYEQGTRAGTFPLLSELLQMARNAWPEGFTRTGTHELRLLLEEMVGLGVLRRTGEDGPFTLRNPDLHLLMGTQEDVAGELQRPRELPDAGAPEEIHPTLAGAGSIASRHPLTLGQIGALSRKGAVLIVAGTRAAGIERVSEALRHAHGEADLLCIDGVSDFNTFAQELKEKLAGASAQEGPTVILVGAQCPWGASWVEAALAEIRRLPAKTGRVKVLFTADAGAAVSSELPDLAAFEEVEVITLRPWTGRFVRHWLQDRLAPEAVVDTDALGARTGFWPLLLEQGQAAGPRSLELFVGRHVRLGQLLGLLARRGLSEQTEIAHMVREAVETVQRDLKLGELLGVVTPAQRGHWRLEPGLGELFKHAVLRA